MKNINDFIKQAKLNGFSDEKIKFFLIKRGVSEELINYNLCNSNNENKNKTKSINYKKIGLISTPVLLFIVLFVLFFPFNQASNFICETNFDCDDYNELTNDICINLNTKESKCINSLIKESIVFTTSVEKVDLIEKEIICLQIENEIHSIYLEKINSDNSIDIQIFSEPKKVHLSLGEKKQIDLDDDGIFDIEIYFEGIINKNVKLSINNLFSNNTYSNNANFSTSNENLDNVSVNNAEDNETYTVDSTTNNVTQTKPIYTGGGGGGGGSSSDDDEDTIPPSFDVVKLNHSNKYLKINDNLIAILNAKNNEENIIVADYCKINNKTITFQELGNGEYELSYTILEGDEDLSSDEIKINCMLKDVAGNKKIISSWTESVNNVTIDANKPTILNVTINVNSINASQRGSDFIINISFSENIQQNNLNISFTPQINLDDLGKDIFDILKNCGGNWITNNTYTYFCDIDSEDVLLEKIHLKISNFKDLVGHEVINYSSDSVFTINSTYFSKEEGIYFLYSGQPEEKIDILFMLWNISPSQTNISKYLNDIFYNDTSINPISNLSKNAIEFFNMVPFIGKEDRFNIIYINRTLDENYFSCGIGGFKTCNKDVIFNKINQFNADYVVIIFDLNKVQNSFTTEILYLEFITNSAPSSLTTTFIHEFGHLMGLNDEYYSKNSPSYICGTASSYGCYDNEILSIEFYPNLDVVGCPKWCSGEYNLTKLLNQQASCTEITVKEECTYLKEDPPGVFATIGCTWFNLPHRVIGSNCIKAEPSIDIGINCTQGTGCYLGGGYGQIAFRPGYNSIMYSTSSNQIFTYPSLNHINQTLNCCYPRVNSSECNTFRNIFTNLPASFNYFLKYNLNKIHNCS
jgi:hypothetical protein